MKKLNLLFNNVAAGNQIGRRSYLVFALTASLFFGMLSSLCAQTTIFVGTGIVSPSVGSNPGSGANGASPYGFNTSFGAMGKKLQIIYTAAQINAAMTAAGFGGGSSVISTVAWDISSNSGSANAHANYTIKMANVAQTSFASAATPYVGASTTVFGPASQAFPSSGTGFLVVQTLTTPFIWDGTSSLFVEVCYTATTPFSLSTYGGTRRTNTASNQMLYNGGAAINCATGSYATAVAAIPNMRLEVTSNTPCAGSPAVSAASSAAVCVNTSETLGLTGLPGAGGYTYVWKYSANSGGPYSPASGTNTNSTYDTPTTLPSVPAYYICEVTCSNSGLTTPSTEGTVTLESFLNCYCTTGFSSAAATSVRGLRNVYLDGNTVTLNNSTAANTANPSPYSLYTTPVADITAGLAYDLKTTVGTATNNLHYVTAWIDYDQDGQFGGYSNVGVPNPLGPFGVGGLILERVAQYGPTTNIQTTTNFTVPANATPGTTAMRVRYRYGATQVGWGPCEQYTGSATGGGAGEVEDYRVQIISACAAPGTGASLSSASLITTTTASVNWTNGSGNAGRLVLLKQGSAVNAGPTSSTVYTANATFESGDELGTGNFVVYKGTGSAAAITGLLPSTTYYYSIFEYNSTGICYELTGETGNFTTASCSPTIQPSGATICAEYTSLNLTFNRGNGDRTIILARAGSAVNATPDYNTSYTANAVFGSGDQVGTGNFVVYNGNNPVSATVNVTGLTPGTAYYFKMYEYFETPNCYNLVSVPSISTTTRNAATYTSSTTTQVTTTVAQNALAQQVVALQVVVGGGADPAAKMNSITFNTTGTTNTATDIINAKIYYTGTSATFSNATQYGTTFTSFAGNLTATDDFTLLPGTNYFWVAYDLNLTATVSNVLDAQIVSFNLTDDAGPSTKIPSSTNPAGSRSIISSAPAGYCIPSHNNASGESLAGVSFAGVSLPDNYGTYSNQTAFPGPTVNPNGVYTLAFNNAAGTLGGSSSAWIDWNQSGTFDTGERVVIDDWSTYISVSVTVPSGATPGATRMRIYLRYCGGGDCSANPCTGSNGSSTVGLTTDFTVTVSGASGVQAVSCPTLVPTGTAPVTYAKGDVASQLSATGTSLLWYTAATGGVGSATAPTPSTTASGTTAYYVTQNTGCESPRTQLAVEVTFTCGPIAYAVTGGTNCYSTTVGLANSESGVSYQLYLDGVATGSPIAGTGSALNFGAQTAAGTYTIKGTDAQPVTSNMSGSAKVWASPIAVISGTLLGCSPAGVTLGLLGSAAGSGTITGRQWQQNGVDIALATGTSYNATVSDNYSVVITNSNACSTTSAPSAVVVNTPPTATGSGTLETCENAAITISGVTTANGTITWTVFTGNGSLTNTGTLTPTYTPDASDAGTTVLLKCTVTNPPCADAVLNQYITIRPRPVLSAANISICTGNPVASISVPTPQANTDYKWSPANDLYLDAALTTPYTLGTPATTVYTAPFGAITYNVTATNTIDNCVTGTTPVNVTVCPALTNGICDADVAAPITVTTTPTFSLYSLTGATVTGGSSCAPIARDIWYRALVPANGELHVITQLHNNPTAALNIQSSVVTIFTGPNCSSVSSVICNSNGAAGNMSYAHATGLTPGTYAYIRLGSTVAGNAPAAQFIRMAVTSGLIWTAAVDNDFSNPANWHGGDATAITFPMSTRSVIIPTTVAKPVLSASVTVNYLTLVAAPPYFGSQGIDLNNFTLSVKGNWTIGPVATANATIACNGIIAFNGTTAQTIGGRTTFGNLTTNNTAFGVTLTNNTGVTCVLHTQGGDLNSNGFLTLRSIAANSAALVNPGSGSIIGNVSVERKIGSISGYHYLSSPVSGAITNNTVTGWRDDFTILSALDNIVFIPGATYTQLPSVWEYQESVNNPDNRYGYVSRTGTGITSSITPLKGFACVVPANTVVDVAGPVNNGPIPTYSVTLTDDGLNLIGNPYPSPISWNAFRTTNSSSLSTSGYQAFISSGSYGGSYGAWNGTAGTSGVTNEIASSQAFMATALGNATVTAANSNRLVSAADVNATFFGYSAVPNLLRMDVKGNGFANQMVVYFDDAASDALDMDAASMLSPTSGVPNIYTKVGNKNVSINAMGTLNMDKVIPLGVNITADATYELLVQDMSTFAPSAMIYLEDTQTGTTVNLRSQPSYSVQLAAGSYNNRFFLHFHPAVELNAVNETCAGNDGQLVINYPTTSTVNIVVKDANGNVVSTNNNVSGVVTVNNLVAGNYVAEMTFGIAPTTYTTSDYFTVAGGNAVIANLSASANTVDMAANTTVNFTATAQGATSFNWNFGDGTVITNGSANVSHNFAQAGTYNVTFEASNGICNTVATTTVEVTNATGLVAATSSDLKVFANASKITIRFGNKMEGTGNIEVINMLGEVVSQLSNVAMKGTREIEVSTIAAGQYMVKITNNNKLYTEKVYLSRQ